MKTEPFLKKIRPEPGGLDFEGLRREGIRLAQEMCGDEWTDYNLHDPGVTVLEQLCYGLTDLVYRTEFPVADYLASAQGEIDFKRLALHRPDDAFSCGPITESDYRKLILDSVPNVENVWIRRVAAGPDGVDGLYRVLLQLSERVKNQDSEGVRDAYAGVVRKLLGANRNLCEDLDEVSVAERIPYGLGGEIEMTGDRAPAAILADIYFECGQYLSPHVAVRPYHEAFKDGADLHELFAGVVTRRGYIADETLHPWRGHFSVQELSGKVGRIAGVKGIRRLEFVSREGKTSDRIRLAGEARSLPVACLRLPLPDDETGVKLFRGGKPCVVPHRDVETEFNRLVHKSHALRNRKQRFDWVNSMLPHGRFRQISQYSSIQHHFPDIYGINANGVPDSVSPQRKSETKQFKAYLLFFEQIMANFLQGLQEVPALFSPDEPRRKSYFHQVLKDDCVPDIERIYRRGADATSLGIARALEDIDDYGDRKNRLLDYLLGIYGEQFKQNSLRQHFGDDVDNEDAAIANKIAFLKRILDIGRSRAAAFDYRKASNGGNSSGLKRKLIVLLALRGVETDFQLVEHVLLRSAAGVSGDASGVPRDFFGFRLSIAFPGDAGRYADADFRRLVEETVSLNCPAHLVPNSFWLDSPTWSDFETLHGNWLNAKREGSGSPEAQAARALVSFLLDIRGGNA